jgi:4'-phosphopantetheinyl transferase
VDILIQSKTGKILTKDFLSNKVGRIQNQDVHLWSVDSRIYDKQKNYSEYFLDKNEQLRAQKFRFKKDHDLFVTGRYLTKILMAYYTNCCPENVKIIAETFGKPTTDLDLFFNLSHSGERLLLGFSNSSIGVDIEREDPRVDTESVGKSNFSETEFKILMNAPDENKISTFFEIWTKKESLIKAIGKGLSISLTNFNVTTQNGKVSWNLPSEDVYGDWYVQKFEGIEGYKSAFATQISHVNTSIFCL